MHYRCLIRALVDATKEGCDKRCLDYHIGDLLKQTIGSHKKRNLETDETRDSQEPLDWLGTIPERL